MPETEFRTKLVKAIEEGVLIFVKFGLIIVLIILSIEYALKIKQAALNGEQAAIAINEYQQKGWLPKFPISEKKDEKVPDTTTNPTK